MPFPRASFRRHFHLSRQSSIVLADGTTMSHASHQCHARSSSTPQDVQPYTYTSGSWLKDEEQQRKARYKDFDFGGLCKRAIDVCPGARTVVDVKKKEGAFNRVFVLNMDNGSTAIARVPFSISGPKSLITHSEVATIEYVRRHTNIPLPEVIDWSGDERLVGSEYIIMKHVPGVPLHDKWDGMNTHERMLCVKSITQITREASRLHFPAYGSIYFLDAPIPQSSKIDLGNGFCLGPHCGSPAWPCHPTHMRSCQDILSAAGPWDNLDGYCSYLARVGIAKLPRGDEPAKPAFWGSVQEHEVLVRNSAEIMKVLTKSEAIQAVAAPMLFHPDLHKRNIYVDDGDPSKVTALIDWQAACVEPTFAFADELPDFLTQPHRIPSNLPGSAQETKNTDAPDKSVDICRRTFEVGVRGWMPAFHQARVTDRTFLNIFRYCSNSWRNSIVPLRQELIDLSHRWPSLGLPGSCPYQPTNNDLREQQEAYTSFKGLRQLAEFACKATNSNPDGWVHSDSWQAAKEANQALFDEWMASSEKDDDSPVARRERRFLWPFDVK